MKAWSVERVLGAAERALAQSLDVELLANNDNRRVVRLATDDGSVIVKLWARPDLQSRLRRLWKSASVHREWNGLLRAHELRVRAPVPLGLAQLPANAGGFTDAIVMGDLGQHEVAIEHLKRLYQANHVAEAQRFEDGLIEMTVRLVGGGLLDADHGLINVVALEDGRPARIDLELARCVRDVQRQPRLLAVMVGHLLATHTFSIQPETALTRAFADRLLARLPLNDAVLQRVGDYVQSRLDLQRLADGITTPIDLPWRSAA